MRRGRPDPEVQILTSAEAVQAARGAGEAYARSLPPVQRPTLFSNIGRYRLSHDEVAHFANDRANAVPRLREIAAGGGAPAAAACIALIELGESGFMERLLELLETPSAGECLAAIAMSGALLREKPGVEVLTTRIDALAHDRARSDRGTAIQAAYILGAVPLGADIVEALVQAAQSTPFPESWIGHALGRLAQGGGDDALVAARALLRPPLLDGMNAIRAGRSREARLLPDLERALASADKKEVRGGLLQALAYVQGRAAVPRLLEALPDHELAHNTTAGLGIAAADSRDEAVIAALTLACAGGSVPSWYADAMARVGGPLAMRTLKGLVRRAGLSNGMFAAWRAQGLTTAMAVRRFIDAGVIPGTRTDSELIAEAKREGDESADVLILWNVLHASGRLVDMSSEDQGASDVARYAIALEKFAAATGGLVVIEHPSQTDAPANARGDRETVVQFVWGDRVYRVTATAPERRFDLLAVRVLLDAALRDRGRPERFVRLPGHDLERFIFGDQRAVEAACDDVFIPHGSDRAFVDEWRSRVEDVVAAAARTS